MRDRAWSRSLVARNKRSGATALTPRFQNECHPSRSTSHGEEPEAGYGPLLGLSQAELPGAASVCVAVGRAVDA